MSLMDRCANLVVAAIKRAKSKNGDALTRVDDAFSLRVPGVP